MATTNSHGWFDFVTHRPWEDWASFVLGLIVLLAPMAIDYTLGTWATVTTAVAAVLIVALALLERVSWKHWEEALEALCGVWLVISPFIFGYGGAIAGLHMTVGVLVVLLGGLEYWQDRNRTED